MLKNLFRVKLNRFDRALWAFSVLVTAGTFLVFGSDDYLSLVSSLIGVTALIFVAKGYALGQLLTMVFAVFYGAVSLAFRYYGEMITYLLMTAPMAAAALVAWLRHPFEDTQEVTVACLGARQWALLLVAAAVVTAAFYFILKVMGNAALAVSTLSITTSFVAAGLTAMRSPYYALAYAANDLVLIVLWVMAAMQDLSCVPMTACFVMFFLNDLYGFVSWRRMERRQRQGRAQ